LMIDDDIMNEDELKGLERLCCSFTLQVPVKLLMPGLKLHMVLKHLAKNEKIDAFAIECWSGLPKALGLNPCLGFIEDSYIIACEGDVVLSIMLLAIKYMTGQISFVGDIQFIDENNIATLCHCGASASLAVNGDVILGKSATAEEQGFSTITCRPALDNGIVTLVRLYGRKCEYMHVACGKIIDLVRCNSFTASIKLSGIREDFIEECFGNHYIVVSGDIRKKLRLFGKWMQINIKET
jgi:L-fucose isomerase-like protein